MAEGSIRVVSKRAGGTKAEPGETVIDIDRTNPVMGNPFLMDESSDASRASVIELFIEMYKDDIRLRGKMYDWTMDVARRVKGGERIAIQCWCKPKDCHGDPIAKCVVHFLKYV